MTDDRSKITEKVGEFLLVAVVLGGILYAATTAYKANETNSRIEQSLSEYRDALTQVKRSLVSVMLKLELSEDQLKELVTTVDPGLTQSAERIMGEQPDLSWEASVEMAYEDVLNDQDSVQPLESIPL